PYMDREPARPGSGDTVRIRVLHGQRRLQRVSRRATTQEDRGTRSMAGPAAAASCREIAGTRRDAEPTGIDSVTVRVGHRVGRGEVETTWRCVAPVRLPQAPVRLPRALYRLGSNPYRRPRSPYRLGSNPYRRSRSPYRQPRSPYRLGSNPYRRP